MSIFRCNAHKLHGCNGKSLGVGHLVADLEVFDMEIAFILKTIVSHMTHCKDVKLLRDPGPVRSTLNETGGSTVKSDDGSVQLRI